MSPNKIDIQAFERPQNTPHEVPNPMIRSSTPLQHLFVSVNNSVSQMESIWDELGVAFQSRADQINDLVTQAQKLFTTSLDEIQKLRNDIYADIQAKTLQHNNLCKVLHSVDEKESSFEQAFVIDWKSFQLFHQQQTLDNKLKSLHSLQATREQNFKNAHAQLYKLHNLLEIPIERSKALKGSQNFPGLNDLSHTRFSEYTNEISDLMVLKKEFDERRVNTLWKEIHSLWDLLHISQIERNILSNRAAELQNDPTNNNVENQNGTLIELLEEQFGALKKERQRRLDDLVRETSAMLHSLWNEYHRITGERIEMPLPAKGTEENVTLIEGLLVEMEDKMKQVDEVCRLCEKRQQLLNEESELLEAQRDPDRLLRKTRGMAAQLLKEEKVRNSIKKDLPRIESRIKSFCQEWQEQHGSDFIFAGVPLMRCVEKDISPKTARMVQTPVMDAEPRPRRRSLGNHTSRSMSGNHRATRFQI